jgi:hypothetical protein
VNMEMRDIDVDTGKLFARRCKGNLSISLLQ